MLLAVSKLITARVSTVYCGQAGSVGVPGVPLRAKASTESCIARDNFSRVARSASFFGLPNRWLATDRVRKRSTTIEFAGARSAPPSGEAA